jgi:pyruvate dehydrogenase E2 component (dihydrolipoamide acetyltransferase)
VLQEVVLPRLGQTVETASIDKWHVSVGDPVRKGDILLEITTDKATLEVESYVEGTLLRTYADEGDQVPVDAVIAYVGDPKTDEAPEEAPAAPAAPEPDAPKAAAPAGTPEPDRAAPAERPKGRRFISPRARRRADQDKVSPLAVRGTGPNGRVVEADVVEYARRVDELRVSPTAREVARRRGVDLLACEGTGIGGRIMKADVEAAAPLGATGEAGRRIELSPARRIIADRMTRSKREAPHFYLQVDVDMTACVALRDEWKAEGRKISFNDLLIKATARGFEAVPAMNASWGGDAIVRHRSVEVSLAVSLEEGLLVPVVRGAERLSLEQIGQRTAGLIEKARTKRLAPYEYEGGSLTISNLGMFGVDNFLPIINPGQGSILGVGRIAERPVAVNGGLAVRKMMGVTLSIDHRVADGATAAEFLGAVKAALEAPRRHLC